MGDNPHVVTLRELLEPYLFCEAVREAAFSAREAAMALAGLGMAERGDVVGVFDDDGHEIQVFEEE